MRKKGRKREAIGEREGGDNDNNNDNDGMGDRGQRGVKVNRHKDDDNKGER